MIFAVVGFEVAQMNNYPCKSVFQIRIYRDSYYIHTMYIEREVTKSIEKSILHNPVTAIIGARQVGKTTLAKEILKNNKNAIYIDLEKYSNIEMLKESEMYFEINKDVSLFCIDEIQLKPNIYNTLRSFVDENKNVRFLILGSASPELLRQTSESLAGRIFYYTLNPFQFEEIREQQKLNNYHLLGGFPKSILSPDIEYSFEWLSNFIRTFLERDLQMFGYNIPPRTLHRLWIMLAYLNSQILNYAALSKSMGINEKTVKKYIDILHHTFMIRLLEPYYVNIKKRLVKSPKMYIKDTGILHALLGIENYSMLFNNPNFGSSWESLVIENIINKYKSWENFFYRTSDGAEIDLVLRKGEKVIAIEIKASLTPKLSKGFWIAKNDISATEAYIIAPVKETYAYKEDVLVYNLEAFLELSNDRI